MSRWECLNGHILEGSFFSPPTKRWSISRAFATFPCPTCGEAMILSREEGAIVHLKRIREFIGKVSKDPLYRADSSLMLSEVGRLEATIRRLAEEAARP